MTSVNPYSGLGASTTGTAAPKKTSLGQDQFLKLMTTQMTHQDPTKPMQNGEFLSQMAQFGTVNGIQGLQASFDSFAKSMSSNQTLQATSLVGRTVSTSSNQVYLAETNGHIKGTVDLSDSSPDVSIKITDPATGNIIRTIDLGSQSAGTVPFTWDGKNDAGKSATSPGVYKVQAQTLLNGYNTVLTPNIESRVESVSMGSGTQGMQVNLAGGLGSVSFNQIKQIL
jgi:flagellar basal-body rod modification protein FlgD